MPRNSRVTLKILLDASILIGCLAVPLLSSHCGALLYGWHRLAQHYTCSQRPVAKYKVLFLVGYLHRWGRFPIFMFSTFLYIGTNRTGIYLKQWGPAWLSRLFGYPALWVPWSDVGLDNTWSSPGWISLTFKCVPTVTIALQVREVVPLFGVAPVKLAQAVRR